MTDASAPGKLVLVGEYAVLDGARAIVASIDVRARAQVIAVPGAESVFFDAANGRAWYFICADNGLRWVGDDPGDKGAILAAACAEIARRPGAFDIASAFRVSLHSEAFFNHRGGASTKFGLGSSAAVLVALVGALVSELHLRLSQDALLALCHAAHRLFQGGRGSGLDVAAAIFGGVVCARTPSASVPVEASPCGWPDGLSILPIWSGVGASTRELLARFDAYRDDNPDEYRRHLARLTARSERACAAWAKGSAGDCLTAFAQYDEALRAFDYDARIGIGTAVHDDIRRLVEGQGAVYKTSGAGGGDFGLALTDSEEQLQAVRAACRKRGLTVLDEPFAVAGLTTD